MTGATAKSAFTTGPTFEDPYTYQVGFGNSFASEAVPNVLPRGMNAPQKVKYDLYSEQLNGSSLVAPRQQIQHVWMYRIRPSVAHGAVSVSDLNSHVRYLDFGTWDRFCLRDQNYSWARGSNTLRGIAIYIYTANVSMVRRAFCNNDGDLLILPQHGRLNMQTELGWLMVQPGELVVIQAVYDFECCFLMDRFGGIFKRFSGHFEYLVASFDVDVDNAPWENHTPFDVVAWHGNLIPYKYAIEKFVNLANVEKDGADPTIYCVLTAKSKAPGVSLTDFLAFTPKWLIRKDTFRPPYYYQNMGTEVTGLIYGRYGGSSHVLELGGLSYEASSMPHGGTYERWKDTTTKELKPERTCEDTIAFIFRISVPMFVTKWVLKGERAKGLHPSSPAQWDNVKAHFLDHIDEVNADLKAAGLPALGQNK
ncbi:putative homogentisate 1,2-dioxygenase [Thelonectria olida]|uniref:homogentisate 1,2-dioxygenase n=1 Tax=Thelonectria olida TaxID=1576542 RepID=A0A9P9AL09_9HYPO|nr:putative homogentisate 1,2-dioxygenase [Thelonectria olida]